MVSICVAWQKKTRKKMAPIKIEKYFLPKIQFHWSGCQKAKILNMIYDYELEIYFNNLRHDGSCTRASKRFFSFFSRLILSGRASSLGNVYNVHGFRAFNEIFKAEPKKKISKVLNRNMTCRLLVALASALSSSDIFHSKWI